MVRKICAKIYSEYIYATNSYPQEAETGVEPSPVQVYVRGHKSRNPSQPDKLCTSVATARLVSCHKTLVLSSLWFLMLSSLRFASMQEKYAEEVVKTHGEGYDWRSGPIDEAAVYASGGRKAHGR